LKLRERKLVQRKLENGEIVFNHKKGRFVHTDNEDKDYEGKQEMKDESVMKTVHPFQKPPV